MKRFFRILTLAAICCTSLLVSSCSKEEVAGDHTPKFTKVEMSLDTRATQSQQQGDKITDVNIWAFEVAADGTVAEQPSGWGKRDYSGVYQETPSGAPVYFELPYSAEAKTYRFVALVNQSAFGNIYKPASTTAQTFTPQTTYSELTKAIFKAGMNIMEGDPSTIEAMPVSHWQDFVIGSGTNDGSFTALTNGTPATFAGTMIVYRALAKAQLSAKLSDESSDNAALKITSATIHVAKDALVPNQGYVFSGLEKIDGQTTGPMAFGDYADVTKSQIREGGLPLQGFNSSVIAKGSNSTYTTIGSTFLFENHRGMTYNANSVSTTSPEDYDAGTFYMKIEYEYGQDENGNIAANGKQTGTNYVPLPPTVRNVLHNVNATFTVDTDGKVTLTYTVAGWVDGGEHSLNFTYPTFSVTAVKTTTNGQLDYSKPTAYFDGTNNEEGAFEFEFTVTAPVDTNKKYTITLSNATDFAYKVYQGSSEVTDIVASDKPYRIKIYPTQSLNQNTPQTTSVSITHQASWTGASEKLLINTTSGGTLWQDSGDDRQAILITQIAAPGGSN